MHKSFATGHHMGTRILAIQKVGHVPFQLYIHICFMSSASAWRPHVGLIKDRRPHRIHDPSVASIPSLFFSSSDWSIQTLDQWSQWSMRKEGRPSHGRSSHVQKKCSHKFPGFRTGECTSAKLLHVYIFKHIHIYVYVYVYNMLICKDRSYIHSLNHIVIYTMQK